MQIAQGPRLPRPRTAARTNDVAANAGPLWIARYFPTFEERGMVTMNPWEIARPDPLGVRAAVSAPVVSTNLPQAKVHQVSAEVPSDLPEALNIPVPSGEPAPPASRLRACPPAGVDARTHRNLGEVMPPEVERLMASEPVSKPSAPVAPMEAAPAAPVTLPVPASSVPITPREPASATTSMIEKGEGRP